MSKMQRTLLLLCIYFFITCEYLTAQPYCSARSDYPFEEWIDGVEFGTISNLNSGKIKTYSSAGYSDFTDLVFPPVEIGNTISFNIIGGTSSGQQASHLSVYIDLNQDGDFEDPDELIYQNNSNRQGTWTVPNIAIPGNTRLRIIADINTFRGPCEAPSRGEVEDYIIEITAGTQVQLPDLEISDLSYDYDDRFQTLAPVYTITNKGPIDFDGAVRLSFYVSPDDQISQDDIRYDPRTSITLEPDSSVEQAILLPPLDLDPDNYYIFMELDSDQQIEEADESNNIDTTRHLVPGLSVNGDLSLSISADDDNPDINQTIRLSVELTNNGDSKVTQATIELIKSTSITIPGNGNPTIGGGQIIDGSQALEWILTEGIDTGTTTTLEIDILALESNADICVQIKSASMEDPDSTPGNFDCNTPLEDDEGTLRLGVGSQDTKNILSLNSCNDTIIDYSECYYGQVTEFFAFNLPEASTTCPGGVITTRLLPGSGAYPYNDGFRVNGPGIRNISFEVTDQCGNTDTCSYQVNIIAKPEFSYEQFNKIDDTTLVFSYLAGTGGAIIQYDYPKALSNCCNLDTLNYRTAFGPKPGDVLTSGTYDVNLVSDYMSCEGRSINNWFTIEVIELPNSLPDMVLNALRYDTLNTFGVWAPTINLFNGGSLDIKEPIKIKTYISDDPILSSDDLVDSINYLFDLKAGESEEFSFAKQPPLLLPGRYYYFLELDADQSVEEINEDNNLRRTPFVIAGANDLSINIDADQADPDIYTTFRLTISITNHGPTDIDNAVVEILKNPSFVMAGNGNIDASKGNLFNNVQSFEWHLSQGLRYGQSATLEIDLFALSTDTDVCVQIKSASDDDTDSTPGNYNCGIPNEDDEGTLRLGVGNSSTTNVLSVECISDTIFDYSNCYTGNRETTYLIEPKSSTTCPGGVVNIELLSNASNTTGRYYVVGSGIFDVSYRITDACGNTELCNYTITVLPYADYEVEYFGIANGDTISYTYLTGEKGALIDYELPRALSNYCNSDTIHYEVYTGPEPGDRVLEGIYPVGLQPDYQVYFFNQLKRVYYLKVTALPATLPDIEGVELVTPPQIVAGESFDMAYKIRNNTDIVITQPFTVKLYATESTLAQRIEPPLHTTTITPDASFVSGNILTVSLEDIIAPLTRLTGISLFIEIDSKNDIIEANESNNIEGKGILIRSIVDNEGIDLDVQLEVSNATPSIFSNITYTLSVVNNGTDDSGLTEINFDFGAQQANRRFAFVSQTDPAYDSWNGVWRIDNLSAGEAKSMSVTLFILPPAAPQTTLTASTNRISNGPDIDPSNNSNTVTINLNNSSLRSLASDQFTDKVNNNSITLFPNPVMDQLTISVQTQEEISQINIQITDINGKPVDQQTIAIKNKFGQTQLDVQDFAPGMYFIKMSEGNIYQSVVRFIRIE